MNQFNLFIDLTRLKKPIGYMLLFWPCTWGLTIAYDFQSGIDLYIFYILLFFFGSVLMRSAGCIINDIADKDFDKKVERTKNRPIASGKISVLESFVYVILLCLLAFLILLQFNTLTIILGMSSMVLAFAYPFMKRITYWPQLFLGLTFNWGIIMGWTALTNNISIEPFLLYLSAIFWTLGYDTIYGYQDIKDDEIIGVKSTSIKFKNNSKVFISFCYFVFISSLVITGLHMNFENNYFLLLMLPFAHLFIFQINKLKINNPNSCHLKFKSNNFLGLIIFIIILVEKNNLLL